MVLENGREGKGGNAGGVERKNCFSMVNSWGLGGRRAPYEKVERCCAPSSLDKVLEFLGLRALLTRTLHGVVIFCKTKETSFLLCMTLEPEHSPTPDRRYQLRKPTTSSSYSNPAALLSLP